MIILQVICLIRQIQSKPKLCYIVGDPGMPPCRVGLSIGDSLAAMFATIGALSALQCRQRTGQGQVVDSAIYEAVLGVMESTVPEYDQLGAIRERTGAILDKVAPRTKSIWNIPSTKPASYY